MKIKLLLLAVILPAAAFGLDVKDYGNPPSVPEGGTSILLLGAAVTGLLLVVRRFKK